MFQTESIAYLLDESIDRAYQWVYLLYSTQRYLLFANKDIPTKEPGKFFLSSDDHLCYRLSRLQLNVYSCSILIFLALNFWDWQYI